MPWDAPSPTDFDGILVGSANVFRHGGKKLDKLTKLPVHAVGEATADAARAAGFLVGRTGRGGLQNLLDELDGRELHLLRLAGEDRVTLRLPDGIRRRHAHRLPRGTRRAAPRKTARCCAAAAWWRCIPEPLPSGSASSSTGTGSIARVSTSP